MKRTGTLVFSESAPRRRRSNRTDLRRTNSERNQRPNWTKRWTSSIHTRTSFIFRRLCNMVLYIGVLVSAWALEKTTMEVEIEPCEATPRRRAHISLCWLEVLYASRWSENTWGVCARFCMNFECWSAEREREEGCNIDGYTRTRHSKHVSNHRLATPCWLSGRGEQDLDHHAWSSSSRDETRSTAATCEVKTQKHPTWRQRPGHWKPH
jgi:hypothetical protein